MDTDISEKDVCCSFADECFDLGILMDCGKGFTETYGSEAATNAESFRCLSEKITDID